MTPVAGSTDTPLGAALTSPDSADVAKRNDNDAPPGFTIGIGMLTGVPGGLT